MPSHKQQRGVTAIEYAILVALIALVILGALSSMGTGNGGIWSYWSNEFVQAVSSVLN